MTTHKYLYDHTPLYVLLLSFKSIHPTKRKYKLSYNLQITLIGVYLYTLSFGNNFSRSAIKDFVSYYNYYTICRYFNIFLDRGLIVQSNNRGKFVYYKLTDQAINIVNEIPLSYNRVLYEFCNKYNIVI